jgi:hypothetical protein
LVGLGGIVGESESGRNRRFRESHDTAPKVNGIEASQQAAIFSGSSTVPAKGVEVLCPASLAALRPRG